MKNGDYHLEAERGRPRLGPLPPGSSVLDAIGGEAAGLTGLQPRTSRLAANRRAKTSATAIGNGRSAHGAGVRRRLGERVMSVPLPPFPADPGTGRERQERTSNSYQLVESGGQNFAEVSPSFISAAEERSAPNAHRAGC